MLFSTTVFLFVFLPVILILYYNPFIKSKKFKNILLLIFSLGFYAVGEPTFVFVMIFSIIANYFFGLLVDKYHHKWSLILAVVFNIGLLFIFKYLTFTLSNLSILFNTDFNFIKIVLPIGISFFTFQALSYVIDVFQRKVKVQRNILKLGLYISFFPQLIAGPIVRYITIADEIDHRTENFEDFSSGVTRFIIGLGKKVLLANSFASIVDVAFRQNPSSLSVTFAWLGAILYSLQIYYDFSGYSDMAIGLGKMFGFHFLENFNYPYIASSITDFWRRWHISLSSWFKDYVYIPLGGSRTTRFKNIRNIFIVWLLTGMWHGANWTFIVWGLMHFSLLILEKQTDFLKWIKPFKHLYTMFFVVIAFMVFRADSLSVAINYFMAMFGSSGILIDGNFMLFASSNIVLITLGIIFCAPIFKCLEEKAKHSNAAAIIYGLIVLLIFIVSITYLVKGTYNPFIYFNF